MSEQTGFTSLVTYARLGSDGKYTYIHEVGDDYIERLIEEPLILINVEAITEAQANALRGDLTP